MKHLIPLILLLFSTGLIAQNSLTDSENIGNSVNTKSIGKIDLGKILDEGSINIGVGFLFPVIKKENNSNVSRLNTEVFVQASDVANIGAQNRFYDQFRLGVRLITPINF